MNQKLSDIGAQSWNTETRTNGLCTTYRIFKKTQSFEKYLVELDPKDRINLCKFRCGSHRLPINTGRFVNINRDERICGVKRGDEFHYLFECQALKVERSECLEKITELGQTRSYSILRTKKSCQNLPDSAR